mmetsp:Transcript_20078/g.56978  ORF Transcript_20078/g.56978 Transcript_20078/m.56978 type:complete len:255 (+) Transcript_20078:30-794(+)
MPPPRPFRPLETHALHGRRPVEEPRVRAGHASARRVDRLPQRFRRGVAALLAQRVPASLGVVRDVEERVEPARAGEVDAPGALGPRRLREVRVAVGEHAVDLAPQHVEAPLGVRLLGAGAREARARPVDAGALADARLARGLGAAAPRPRLAGRGGRERAAPRKERASKFLPAAVAEQDLDDALRAFVLPELGGPQVLTDLRPPSEPLRELQSQEPLRDLARHDKTPPAAPAPREADAVPPPPACISKQTRVPS